MNLLTDFKFALRSLGRVKGLTLTVVVTLALGIGANAAIFSVVRAVVLRPPPYRDPSRLVTFLNSRSEAAGSITSSSLPEMSSW